MDDKKKFFRIDTLKRALAILLAALIIFTGGMIMPAGASGYDSGMIDAELKSSRIAIAAAAEAGSSESSAGGAMTRIETVTETRTLTDVAYYDVWKHINGTWQFGKKPGSSVTASFTIYIAGRLPEGANVTAVNGSFDDSYSGSYSMYAVPGGSVSVKSFNNKNLTYSVSTTLNGSPMDLRNDSQSEYTEGYRYYIPTTFEVTYTLEKEIVETVPDTDDTGSGDTDDEESSVSMSGEAVLELPSVTYEGHTVQAVDRSVFDVDGKTYGAAQMYDEGLASNKFTASGDSKVKRVDDTEADVTFNKPGTQNVTLKVKTDSGDTLTDKKNIEVLKTPAIIETLGGTQKENRRQVLTILVAENPSYPLSELWVELEEKGGGSRVHLEHDVSKTGGSGATGNVNDNSMLIKTRPISDTGSDNKFTRVELEFLTKNDDQIDMTYRIYAKDTRGNIDKVERNFIVMPDEPPMVVIESENPQFRDEGSDTAYVYAEDATAYDGDDAERSWYVREEVLVPSGGALGTTESAAVQKTEWTEWTKADDTSGLLMDASFGTWRGVAYKKNGVGKVEFRLDVKDKWIEETLEEYVTDADRLTGSGSVQTVVDNIAPIVSLSAEKMKRGNLLMLAQSEAEKLAFEAGESKLNQKLLESGISSEIHTQRIKTESELNISEMPDAVSKLIRPYGYGVESTFLEKGWYMADSNTLYTVDATWTQNTASTKIYSYNIAAPYTIKAYKLDDDESRFRSISESTVPTWQITIAAEQLDNVGVGSIKGMAQDDTDEYLYFVTNAKTLIYDKESGVFVGSVPLAFGDDNFVAEDRIFTLKSDGLYSVNLRTGNISNVYAGKIIMKNSYSDPAGSAKRINNEINFATGNGAEIMRVAFNPNTEEVRLAAVRPTGATYASTYNISGFGLDGKLCLLRDSKAAYHIIDGTGTEVAYKSGWSTAREHDVLPVYKSDGTFDYVAVLVNGYTRTGTSSTGYKYKYSINETVYDISGTSAPITYSYTRTTGSGGTSGSGTDAGKAMYAVQFGKYIVVCTGNWSTCISDGSALGAYYNTSFVQMVFDTEAGSVSRYGGGSTLFSALNTGGYYCEYGQINDDYVVSAYSNVSARSAYGEGTNQQMLTVARLPKTAEIEAAIAIDSFAPVKSSVGLDSAAVVIGSTDSATDNDSAEGIGDETGLDNIAESAIVQSRVRIAENTLISDVNLFGALRNAEQADKIGDGDYETAEALDDAMQSIASNMASSVGESGGLKIITDGSGGENVSSISKMYNLKPDTEYFYEIEYSGDSAKPVCFNATFERAAGTIETSDAGVGITGHSYIVTEIQSEDFSSFDNINKYFGGITSGRTADGVYYGAALHRSKDSSSKNRAISDSSKLTFTIEDGRKAIVVFDYQMAADRSAIDQAYVNINGARWYRNVTLSDAKGTYMHPHILEAGIHEIGFGAKDYGRRPVDTYMIIDNLKVIYIEESNGTLGEVVTGANAEAAVLSGTPTQVSYGDGAVKGSFRTPNEIASYQGQSIRYINAVPDAGAIDIAVRTDTDNMRGLRITIPEDQKAVFTAISVLSSPSDNRAVKWTIAGKSINVSAKTNDNYYPGTVPSPLKVTTDTRTGSISASTGTLYKVGAGFANLEMVLTPVLNNSIEADKYFISPETSELFFEDELFNGKVEMTISGSGEWSVKDFKLYYIDDGKRVYVEDGYMNASDAAAFKVSSGTLAVERVDGKTEEAPTIPIYQKGEVVDYKTTYFDYENDPSKAQYWRYTHIEANDGLHPDAGKILNAPIEKFYVDGKYIVEHWQEDSTGRVEYDKVSNTAEMTFYIGGIANTPWVESVKTNPAKPTAGDSFSLSITVNDIEKDPLSLTTEVYYGGKLIYTHKKDDIIANAAGRYPAVNTGTVTSDAKEGTYSVICTVRDEFGAGIGVYEFEIKLDIKITGEVDHFPNWEQKRLEYNAANPAHPRSSNTYWASEAFDLTAEVIGKPLAVTVTTEEFPEKTVTLTKVLGTDTGAKATYSGTFFDSKIAAALAKEGTGDLTFIFTATYSGGKKATDRVTVIIDDTGGSDMKLHRVW